MKLPAGYRRALPPRLGEADAGIDDEIRFHVESRVADLMEDGIEELEARRRAEAEFGDVERAARRSRRELGRGGMVMGIGNWLREGARDTALALRQLRRNPGFAAVALATLTLGIGGTAAIYSVVDAVLLRPLPYPDEDHVVRIWPAAPGAEGSGGSRGGWSIPDVDDWRERASSLSAIGAYTTGLGGLVVTSAGTPEEVRTAYVTAGFFEALGTPASVGRTLPPEAEEADPRMVVLSDGFWRRHLGADPSAVGSLLDTQDGAFRITGVLPPEFAFPDPDVELWTFLSNVEQASVPWLIRGVRVFDAVARLSPGATRALALEDLQAVAAGLARELPESNGGITSAEILAIRDAIIGDVRLPLLLVAGAVGLTLLIACVNVANLLLARGTARAREFALRASLGAGRARLARQVLAESLLLGALGGALGLLFAGILLPALVAGADTLLPRADDIHLNGRVLGFALAVSAVTGMVFGLLPAMGVGRRASTEAGGGARGSTAGSESRRLLASLVFVEVGLAVVLLVGGSLLMRSFTELRSVDPGFDAEGLLVADMVVSDVRYESSEEYLAFRDQLLDRLRGLPGVIGATTAKEFPTRGTGEGWSWSRQGDPPAVPGEERTARALHVDRAFFDVMGIPLVAGAAPGDEPELSIVINERLARESYGSAAAAVGSSLEVAGTAIPIRAVVGDVLHADPSAPPPAMIYLDDRINARRVFSFIMRTSGDPLQLVEPFRRTLADLDSAQPISSIYTARSAWADAVEQPRFFALLMSIFAAGAAMLAAIGIYGVIAYSVRRRTREIGVRVALGASRGELAAMVLRESLKPVLPGVIVGLAAAAALSGLLSSLLFEIGRTDPISYAGVALGLLAVAVLASLAPALEATRVDPQVALSSE